MHHKWWPAVVQNICVNRTVDTFSVNKSNIWFLPHLWSANIFFGKDMLTSMFIGGLKWYTFNQKQAGPMPQKLIDSLAIEEKLLIS